MSVLPVRSKDGYVQCHLKQVILPDASTASDGAASYAALSYTWGDPQPLHTIIVDGSHFAVRSNLHGFLAESQAGVAKGSEIHALPIFIDAICIDQRNLLERHHQVRLMSDIYRCANKTLIWLGHGNPYLERLFEGALFPTQFLQNVDAYKNPSWGGWKNSSGELDPRTRNELFEALEKLFDHVYWTRAWILQEVALSRDKRVLYGSRHLSWAHLLALETFMDGTAHGVGHFERGADYVAQLRATDPKWRVGGMFHERRLEMAPVRGSLLKTIQHYRRRECTELYDRVYALVGLSKKAHHFPVCYESSPLELLLNSLAFGIDDRESDADYVLSSVAFSSSSLQRLRRMPFADVYLTSWILCGDLGIKPGMRLGNMDTGNLVLPKWRASVPLSGSTYSDRLFTAARYDSHVKAPLQFDREAQEAPVTHIESILAESTSFLLRWQARSFVLIVRKVGDHFRVAGNIRSGHGINEYYCEIYAPGGLPGVFLRCSEQRLVQWLANDHTANEGQDWPTLELDDVRPVLILFGLPDDPPLRKAALRLMADFDGTEEYADVTHVSVVAVDLDI